MQIIFTREAAETLRSKYTVLELETFEVEGKQLEAFCVVPADKINLGELPLLEQHSRVHQSLVDALKEKNYSYCVQAIEILHGKFGGELDSFYSIIKQRAELALEQN